MVVGRIGQKGVLLISCLGALSLIAARVIGAEHPHDLLPAILAAVLATIALAAMLYARRRSKRDTAEASPGAATFRADQARPLAGEPPAKVTLAERLVFLGLLAVLGGIGAELRWATWAAALAAMAFAGLMARDMVVRRDMSLGLAPFYAVTLFGGYGLFILAGWAGGAFLLAR